MDSRKEIRKEELNDINKKLKDKFIFLYLIAVGGFSCVYKIRKRANGQSLGERQPEEEEGDKFYALKNVKFSANPFNYEKKIKLNLREVECLNKLKDHPNIVGIRECWLEVKERLSGSARSRGGVATSLSGRGRGPHDGGMAAGCHVWETRSGRKVATPQGEAKTAAHPRDTNGVHPPLLSTPCAPPKSSKERDQHSNYSNSDKVKGSTIPHMNLFKKKKKKNFVFKMDGRTSPILPEQTAKKKKKKKSKSAHMTRDSFNMYYDALYAFKGNNKEGDKDRHLLSNTRSILQPCTTTYLHNGNSDHEGNVVHGSPFRDNLFLGCKNYSHKREVNNGDVLHMRHMGALRLASLSNALALCHPRICKKGQASKYAHGNKYRSSSPHVDTPSSAQHQREQIRDIGGSASTSKGRTPGARIGYHHHLSGNHRSGSIPNCSKRVHQDKFIQFRHSDTYFVHELKNIINDNTTKKRKWPSHRIDLCYNDYYFNSLFHYHKGETVVTKRQFINIIFCTGHACKRGDTVLTLMKGISNSPRRKKKTRCIQNAMGEEKNDMTPECLMNINNRLLAGRNRSMILRSAPCCGDRHAHRRHHEAGETVHEVNHPWEEREERVGANPLEGRKNSKLNLPPRGCLSMRAYSQECPSWEDVSPRRGSGVKVMDDSKDNELHVKGQEGEEGKTPHTTERMERRTDNHFIKKFQHKRHNFCATLCGRRERSSAKGGHSSWLEGDINCAQKFHFREELRVEERTLRELSSQQDLPRSSGESNYLNYYAFVFIIMSGPGVKEQIVLQKSDTRKNHLLLQREEDFTERRTSQSKHNHSAKLKGSMRKEKEEKKKVHICYSFTYCRWLKVFIFCNKQMRRKGFNRRTMKDVIQKIYKRISITTYLLGIRMEDNVYGNSHLLDLCISHSVRKWTGSESIPFARSTRHSCYYHGGSTKNNYFMRKKEFFYYLFSCLLEVRDNWYFARMCDYYKYINVVNALRLKMCRFGIYVDLLMTCTLKFFRGFYTFNRAFKKYFLRRGRWGSAMGYGDGRRDEQDDDSSAQRWGSIAFVLSCIKCYKIFNAKLYTLLLLQVKRVQAELVTLLTLVDNKYLNRINHHAYSHFRSLFKNNLYYFMRDENFLTNKKGLVYLCRRFYNRNGNRALVQEVKNFFNLTIHVCNYAEMLRIVNGGSLQGGQMRPPPHSPHFAKSPRTNRGQRKTPVGYITNMYIPHKASAKGGRWAEEEGKNNVGDYVANHHEQNACKNKLEKENHKIFITNVVNFLMCTSLMRKMSCDEKSLFTNGNEKEEELIEGCFLHNFTNYFIYLLYYVTRVKCMSIYKVHVSSSLLRVINVDVVRHTRMDISFRITFVNTAMFRYNSMVSFRQFLQEGAQLGMCGCVRQGGSSSDSRGSGEMNKRNKEAEGSTHFNNISFKATNLLHVYRYNALVESLNTSSSMAILFLEHHPLVFKQHVRLVRGGEKHTCGKATKGKSTNVHTASRITHGKRTNSSVHKRVHTLQGDSPTNRRVIKINGPFKNNKWDKKFLLRQKQKRMEETHFVSSIMAMPLSRLMQLTVGKVTLKHGNSYVVLIIVKSTNRTFEPSQLTQMKRFSLSWFSAYGAHRGRSRVKERTTHAGRVPRKRRQRTARKKKADTAHIAQRGQCALAHRARQGHQQKMRKQVLFVKCLLTQINARRWHCTCGGGIDRGGRGDWMHRPSVHIEQRKKREFQKRSEANLKKRKNEKTREENFRNFLDSIEYSSDSGEFKIVFQSSSNGDEEEVGTGIGENVKGGRVARRLGTRQTNRFTQPRRRMGKVHSRRKEIKGWTRKKNKSLVYIGGRRSERSGRGDMIAPLSPSAILHNERHNKRFFSLVTHGQVCTSMERVPLSSCSPLEESFKWKGFNGSFVQEDNTPHMIKRNTYVGENNLSSRPHFCHHWGDLPTSCIFKHAEGKTPCKLHNMHFSPESPYFELTSKCFNSEGNIILFPSQELAPMSTQLLFFLHLQRLLALTMRYRVRPYGGDRWGRQVSSDEKNANGQILHRMDNCLTCIDEDVVKNYLNSSGENVYNGEMIQSDIFRKTCISCVERRRGNDYCDLIEETNCCAKRDSTRRNRMMRAGWRNEGKCKEVIRKPHITLQDRTHLLFRNKRNVLKNLKKKNIIKKICQIKTSYRVMCGLGYVQREEGGEWEAGSYKKGRTKGNDKVDTFLMRRGTRKGKNMAPLQGRMHEELHKGMTRCYGEGVLPTKEEKLPMGILFQKTLTLGSYVAQSEGGISDRTQEPAEMDVAAELRDAEGAKAHYDGYSTIYRMAERKEEASLGKGGTRGKRGQRNQGGVRATRPVEDPSVCPGRGNLLRSLINEWAAYPRGGKLYQLDNSSGRCFMKSRRVTSCPALLPPSGVNTYRRDDLKKEVVIHVSPCRNVFITSECMKRGTKEDSKEKSVVVLNSMGKGRMSHSNIVGPDPKICYPRHCIHNYTRNGHDRCRTYNETRSLSRKNPSLVLKSKLATKKQHFLKKHICKKERRRIVDMVKRSSCAHAPSEEKSHRKNKIYSKENFPFGTAKKVAKGSSEWRPLQRELKCITGVEGGGGLEADERVVTPYPRSHNDVRDHGIGEEGMKESVMNMKQTIETETRERDTRERDTRERDAHRKKTHGHGVATLKMNKNKRRKKEGQRNEMYRLNLYIRMEYCDNTLENYISGRTYVNYKRNKEIIHMIILGLHYMHKNNIIHRDLKPSNIFICDNDVVKIGDFGLASYNDVSRQQKWFIRLEHPWVECIRKERTDEMRHSKGNRDTCHVNTFTKETDISLHNLQSEYHMDELHVKSGSLGQAQRSGEDHFTCTKLEEAANTAQGKKTNLWFCHLAGGGEKGTEYGSYVNNSCHDKGVNANDGDVFPIKKHFPLEGRHNHQCHSSAVDSMYITNGRKESNFNISCAAAVGGDSDDGGYAHEGITLTDLVKKIIPMLLQGDRRGQPVGVTHRLASHEVEMCKDGSPPQSSHTTAANQQRNKKKKKLKLKSYNHQEEKWHEAAGNIANSTHASSYHTLGIGTKMYSAPEQLVGKRYNKAVDMFSLGLIIVDLFTRTETNMERTVILCNARQRILPDSLIKKHPSVANLCKNLLSLNYESRFTSEDLYNKIISAGNVFTFTK
ncbi:PEK protein kinase [Plasmodium fragile]|uniref:non-specific serine/threonine protein kinase n=1 Tax=Plasmodium fragile TaxID=5857 RepID=A0A0D9QTS8_PLAFR|nr:PEK protein kinase [Plasmodium fragile]KJP89181.1 PEK protein kinase [Plasmodium fragile]